MLRRLIIAVACGLCFAWNPAQALGLGEIVLGSGLNQRFTAEIPFTSLSPEEAANVRARLAENADFERAGLERSAYLSSLKVDVITGDSNPRVVLSSDEIAREPLLTLLIEVKTVGAGPRVLREYTVFLDPPGMGAAAPPPQARPMALPGGSAASAADEFYEAAGDGQSSAAVGSPAPPRDTYGPIRAGETLTTIARSLRPTGVTLDQTVLALFETNPDAFSNRDINSLRRDAVLAVPSPGRMQATSAEAAHTRLEELRQSQFVQNTTARAMAPAIVSRPLPSAPSRPSTPPPAAEEEIEVADAEVDAPATAEPASPATAATDAAATANTGESAAAADAEADAPADAVASVNAPADASAEDASATAGNEEAAAEAEPSAAGESNLLWIVIGLLVLGGVIFLVVRAVRERRAQQEYAEASSTASELPLPRAGATGSIAKSAMSTRDELEALDRQFSDEERMASGEADDALADSARVEPSLSSDPYADAGSSDETPDVSSQDPLAEAEFHLAYGLHDEAEAQLLKASKREPERTDLKVKLAETYFATGKAREFVGLTQELKLGLSDSDWEKLAAMGRDLAPSDPNFQPSKARPAEPAPPPAMAPSTVPEAAPDLVDQGLDFRLEELELPTAAADTKDADAGRKPDSNLLEFDLGEFDLGTPEPESRPAAVQPFNPDNFDLDTVRQSERGPLPDLALDDLEPLAIDLSGSDDVGNGDDAGTKLDLARAYLEMGDMEMARSLLDEVATQGTEAQKRDAAVLRERLSA